jgi:DNA-binding MarR family transcriptional regulator
MASNRAVEGLRNAISPLQLRALTVLALGSQRLIDLADAVGVAPSTATRLCDALMAEGLISKDRDDVDRREVHLSLAPRGRRLLSDLETRRRLEFEGFVKTISIKERRQLIGVLRALNEGAPPDLAG